jgi:hypothetical protein
MTLTRRRVLVKVSCRTNDFGSHSLSGTIRSAPPLDTSAMRHASDLPSSSSILAGRLTGCLTSLRMKRHFGRADLTKNSPALRSDGLGQGLLTGTLRAHMKTYLQKLGQSPLDPGGLVMNHVYGQRSNCQFAIGRCASHRKNSARATTRTVTARPASGETVCCRDRPEPVRLPTVA